MTRSIGPGRYAGFDLAARPLISDGTTTSSIWAAPTLTLTYAPVPEPASMAALGLGALALLRRRRRA